MMKIPALALTLVMLSFGLTVGQEPSVENTGPVNWILYRDKAAKVAVSMPKLPVRIDSNDICAERLTSTFYAYAEQAVYEFRFYRKGKPIPKWCSRWSTFDQSALTARLEDLRTQRASPQSDKPVELAGRKATEFRSAQSTVNSVRWVIPDMDNDRWLELAITYRPDARPEEKRFSESVRFTAQEGTDIESGSPSTVGDLQPDPPAPTEAVQPGSDASRTDPLIIVAKPKPSYTDVARNNKTQGTVRLRVTFSKNGSVRFVTVDGEALPNGLTEMSIAVARRIVFLPARAKGTTLDVTKQVEYSFSIY